MAASSMEAAGVAGAEADHANAGRPGVVVGAAESVAFRTPAEPAAALPSASHAIDLTGGAVHAAAASDPAAEAVGGAGDSGSAGASSAPGLAAVEAVDAAEAGASAASEPAAEAAVNAAEAGGAGAEAMDVDSDDVAAEARGHPPKLSESTSFSEALGTGVA
jgi:hypothetical protein